MTRSILWEYSLLMGVRRRDSRYGTVPELADRSPDRHSGAMQQGAVVGVAEHGNSAVLITLGPDKGLLDRRRIDLTTGLPTHPYHHEGSWAIGRYADSPWAKAISLPDAVALVERVHESAARGALD